jgi:hypothetical protein
MLAMQHHKVEPLANSLPVTTKEDTDYLWNVTARELNWQTISPPFFQ